MKEKETKRKQMWRRKKITLIRQNETKIGFACTGLNSYAQIEKSGERQRIAADKMRVSS